MAETTNKEASCSSGARQEPPSPLEPVINNASDSGAEIAAHSASNSASPMEQHPAAADFHESQQVNNGNLFISEATPATAAGAGPTTTATKKVGKNQKQAEKGGAGDGSTNVASQRSSKTGTVAAQSTGGRSKFVPRGAAVNNNTRTNQFDQPNSQMMYRTNPRKQEPVLGIGPGGTDLSQFFQQNINNSGGSYTNNSKPQTAGTLGGTLLMEAGEFGLKSANSKNSPSGNGPNITNIGFAIANTVYPQTNSIAITNNNPGNQRNQGHLPMPNRTGSFKMTQNERSKSFNTKKSQQMMRKQQMQAASNQVMSGEYSSAGVQLGIGFNQMKPFIQGSSLHKGAQAKNSRTGFASSQNPTAKRPDQFTDYNFFSQKLNKNNIPKNQMIKYRKEMQQLKFYQTLNNYPNIVQQQKEKDQQMALIALQSKDRSSMSYSNRPLVGNSHQNQLGTLAEKSSKGNLVTLQPEGSLVTESKDRGSTKQTVYQMHSSRQKLETDHAAMRKSAQERQNLGVSRGGINETSNHDLQQKSSIQAEPYGVNAARYNDQKSLSYQTTLEKQREEKDGTVALTKDLTGKASIENEAEVQYSTHIPSFENPRAIFDSNLKPSQQISESNLNNNSLTELAQPAIMQTKKVVTPTTSQFNTNAIQSETRGHIENSGTSTTLLNAKSAGFQTLKSAQKTAMDEITSSGPDLKDNVDQEQDESAGAVERVEIKQQIASASYLTKSNSRLTKKGSQQPSTSTIPPAIRPKVFLHTQTASQEHLIPDKKMYPEIDTGLLVITGNQVKKDTGGGSEINRTQSMKPMAEPLINNKGTNANKESTKSGSYWGTSGVRAANAEDGGQTEHLKDGKKSITNNNDAASQGTTACIITPFQPNQQLSDEMPYSNNILKGTQSRTTGVKTKGGFEEQVSGVGVSGLFSVWGPSSQQTKHHGRRQKPTTGTTYQHDQCTGATLYGKRTANTADVNKRTGGANMLGLGLDGVEPGNMAHHMQLVNSIINDGSVHNLVFSNGSLTSADYLQQNRSQVAKLLQGGAVAAERDTVEDGGDYDDEDESEEDEDKEIIITMMKSMNSKKLETYQLRDMQNEIDIEKIRTDVKLEFFKRIQRKRDELIDAEWRHRMVRFDHLFNQIIAKKLQLDKDNTLMLKLEEQAKVNEERLTNPYYMTLLAQKQEREKFIDFYQSNTLLGFQVATGDEDNYQETQHEEVSNSLEAIGDSSFYQAAKPQPVKDDIDGDLFKHTRIDIDEVERHQTGGTAPDKGEQHQHTSSGSSQQKQEQISKIMLTQLDDSIIKTRRQKDDIFCFYKLSVNLPKTFLEKHGDPKVVRAEATTTITKFIKQQWPTLAQKKRITYRVGYDALQDVLHTVPLGKEAPLSRCCMTYVNFIFSRAANTQQSGKVLCTNPLCAKEVLDTFDQSEQLVHTLFEIGLRYQDLPMTGHQNHFMSSRRRMQDEGATTSKTQLAQRYRKAASAEISKKIGAGKYKHCKLQNVVTDTKFQQEHLVGTGSRLNTSDDLMDMIMGVSRRNTEYASHTNTSYNEIHNENQMLAELIQKHSVAKNKHRASLPLNKLMRAVTKPPRSQYQTQQNQHQQQQQYLNQYPIGHMSGQGQTTRLEDGTYNVQFFDSMFQHSQQFGISVDQNNQQLRGTDQKADVRDNIYTQENQFIQQQPYPEGFHQSSGSNADIPDANSHQNVLTQNGNLENNAIDGDIGNTNDNSYQQQQDQLQFAANKPLLLNHQVFQEPNNLGSDGDQDHGKKPVKKLSGRNNTNVAIMGGKDGGKYSNLVTSGGEDSNTIGNTMTADNLNDPRYSQNSKLVSVMPTKNSQMNTERNGNEQMVVDHQQIKVNPATPQ